MIRSSSHLTKCLSGPSLNAPYKYSFIAPAGVCVQPRDQPLGLFCSLLLAAGALLSEKGGEWKRGDREEHDDPIYAGGGWQGRRARKQKRSPWR